jgi:hypothetical protein
MPDLFGFVCGFVCGVGLLLCSVVCARVFDGAI